MKALRFLSALLVSLLLLWRVLDFWGEWAAGGRFHMTLGPHVLYGRPALFLQLLIILSLFTVLFFLYRIFIP